MTPPDSTTEPIVITRDIELDVSSDELWQLVADGNRWAEWLTDAADVVVEPAREGSVLDEDGIQRRVAIQSVVPGRSVRFAWWPTDRPGESSLVELVVAPVPGEHDGDHERSRLTVVETYAAASAETVTAALAGWNLRLLSLTLCIETLALVRA